MSPLVDGQRRVESSKGRRKLQRQPGRHSGPKENSSLFRFTQSPHVAHNPVGTTARPPWRSESPGTGTHGARSRSSGGTSAYARACVRQISISRHQLREATPGVISGGGGRRSGCASSPPFVVRMADACSTPTPTGVVFDGDN